MREEKPNSPTEGTPAVLTETELSERWKVIPPANEGHQK